MAIKQYISLEGAQKMIDDMARVQKQAQAMVDVVAKAGGAEIPLPAFQQALGQAGEGFAKASESARGFTEALHIVRPALEEIGLSVGGLRDLSVLARVGIGGLATAITGALLIALAKASDAAAIARAKLGDILGGAAAGQTAFGRLEEDAARLGTTAESLVPIFTTLQRVFEDTSSIHFFAAPGQELPAFLSNAGKAEKAAADLFTTLRFGRASFDEAAKASQAFADALEKSGGKITSAMLIPIRQQFPAAFNAIKDALGGAGATVTAFFASLDKHPKTIEQLDGAFQQLARQIPETFDASKPQSFSDALTIIGNQIKAAFVVDQPKRFEAAIAALGPAIANLVAQLVKIAPDIFRGLAAEFNKIHTAIQATITDVFNLGEIFATVKDIIDKFFTAPPRETFAAFQHLKDILAEIGRTGAAPGAGPDRLKQAFEDAKTSAGGVEGAVKQAGDQTQRAADLTADLAKNWNDVGKSVDNVAEGIGDVTKRTVAFQGFVPTQKFAEVPPPGADPFAKAAAASADQQSEAAGKMVSAFEQAKAQIQEIWSQIVAIFKPDDISGALDPIAQDMPAPFEIAADVIDGIFSGIVRAAQQMAQDVNAAMQSIRPPGGGGGGFSEIPLAGGGLVSGPGSTTSDSITARLSNFEYVMRAAAVKFYGVDLMHALNAMRLPKDFFRGFNLGGLALPLFPAPTFAQGGLATASSQRSLTLVLDGKSFAMAGSKNVVDDLERAADLHNLSRIGRAPGWIR